MIPLPEPWRYFAKSKDGTQVRGGWVVPAFLDQIRQDLVEFNLYVTLNRSVGLGIRANTETVVGWRAVLLDLDPAEDSVPARDLDVVLAAASELLGLPLDPTIIDTGRGYHAWLQFPEVAPPRWAGQATRDFLKALAAVTYEHAVFNRWKLDLGVSDLARLARMPGTINQKTGRVASVVSVGSPSPGIPAALEARFRKDRNQERAAPEGWTLPASAPWGLFLDRITMSAARFLTEGAGSGSRHDGLCQAAYSLRDYGCSEEEILSALRFGNALCEDPLSDFEVVRVHRTTRRYAWVKSTNPAS